MSQVLVPRELLERLEWCGGDAGGECLVCCYSKPWSDDDGNNYGGHDPDCHLAYALAQPDHECACLLCAIRAPRAP